MDARSPTPRQRPTQHILTDRAVVHALEDAAGRGVDVRVLLEPHPFGEGDVSATRMLEELRAAGVQARQADPAYHYTHEKALVVDHATAYSLTSNLIDTPHDSNQGILRLTG